MSEVYSLLEEGRYEQALARLRDVPQNRRDFEYYYEEGLTHLLLRHFDLARGSFEMAVGAEPEAHSTEALEGAALSTWLAGNHERAVDEMLEVVESIDRGVVLYSSDGLGLGPRLRLAALLALSDLTERALDVIGNLDVAAGSRYWPVPIAQFLQSNISAAQLVEFASTSVSGGRRSEQAANRDLCLVEFYVGIASQLTGDKAKRREMFRLAARRNAILEWEWYLAVALTGRQMPA